MTLPSKYSPESITQDRERLLRFEQEAKSAGMLNHPNLLTIFDVGESAGSPYIVSELLEGETLRDRLDHGPIPNRKVVDYGLQLSQGLAAAHEKGLVHRDLKPENIFITNEGRVKILD
ncbi:MAG TPA: serine/threonine-protein kinase [Thermoanaerobaculia bacterium]|nr:serine/threonine-protein kinase [Thermoanaerobaculia bacterium]